MVCLQAVIQDGIKIVIKNVHCPQNHSLVKMCSVLAPKKQNADGRNAKLEASK